MNYVKQALAIPAHMKQRAARIYMESVAKICSRDYANPYYDAHTELSAIFGDKWILETHQHPRDFLCPVKFAEANVAFNFAHLTYGARGQFAKLARSLIPAEQRVSEKKLQRMQQTMNCYLTLTTPKDIRAAIKADRALVNIGMRC